MNNKQDIGMVIGCVGLAFGLWVDWQITLAMFVMMWGDNIIRDNR